MAVELLTKDQTLIAVLTGEIDHHSARSLRAEIDDKIELYQPTSLVLDFSGVTFMDSSGIGLIIGRHRLMETVGGEVVIQNPQPHIQRVMRLSGMERIAHIHTNLRPNP